MKSALKTRYARIIIWIIAILLTICISAVVFYLMVVPFGANGYFYWFGCVELTDGEVTRPPANICNSFEINGYYDSKINQSAHLAYVALQFKLISYEKTDDVPTDAEIFQFSFNDYTMSEYSLYEPVTISSKEIQTHTFAYDFYSKKVYALRDGDWYLVKENRVFNSIIQHCLDWNDPWGFPERWRGQSLYGQEEMRFEGNKFDLKNPTFRYDLHWSWRYRIDEEKRELYEYRDSGFNNTDAVSITNNEEAIARAAKELGFENPIGYVFYDKTCGYWMVELYEDKGITPAWNNEYTHMLAEEVMTVIMDNNGVTLEIFNSVTSCYQFIRDY